MTAEDVAALRAFVEQYSTDPFVVSRTKRNLAKRKRRLDRADVWHALVGCLLTTQQRSGPNSRVARLMRARPFPLAYERVAKSRHREDLVVRSLQTWGGIRRGPTIGRQLSRNLELLEGGRWDEVLRAINALRSNVSREEEHAVAQALAAELHGLGPKQSRNLLQSLGLTRYEVPIDSRLTRWLNDFGFPVKLSANALSDQNYYDLISDGFQQLCAAAGVHPCVVDAAIFASYDSGRWTRSNAGTWGRPT